MVTIAKHCIDNPARPHTLRHPWPEQAYVQWGGGGVVIRNDGSGYTTAFFEAFTNDNASDFIRGEGATIAEAEMAAFLKWQHQVDCPHPHWQRRNYRNGLGTCAKCGARKSVFRSLYDMDGWRKPITPTQAYDADHIWKHVAPDPRALRYQRKLQLRRKLFGVGPTGQAKGMDALIERIVSRETQESGDG